MAQETHSGTQAHGGGEGAFPPFDPATFTPSLFWLLISFGLLFLMLWRVAVPRVEGILKTRFHSIQEKLAEARKMHKDAKDAAAGYDKTLSEAKSRAQALASETRANIKLSQDAKRQSLEADIDQKMKSAEVQIAESKANAMASVGDIAIEATHAIIERLTGQPADKTMVAKAVADSRS